MGEGGIKEQQCASVPREREEREKGFEGQHKKLDAILDASGGLGTVVLSVQIAHVTNGTGPSCCHLCDVTGHCDITGHCTISGGCLCPTLQ